MESKNNNVDGGHSGGGGGDDVVGRWTMVQEAQQDLPYLMSDSLSPISKCKWIYLMDDL